MWLQIRVLHSLRKIVSRWRTKGRRGIPHLQQQARKVKHRIRHNKKSHNQVVQQEDILFKDHLLINLKEWCWNKKIQALSNLQTKLCLLLSLKRKINKHIVIMGTNSRLLSLMFLTTIIILHLLVSFHN